MSAKARRLIKKSWIARKRRAPAQSILGFADTPGVLSSFGSAG